MNEYGKPIFGTVTDAAPQVRTTHGEVLGENRNGVAVFRGIPYGADCGGDRRFLPPVAAGSWDGVRDCTKNGPICYQYGGSINENPDEGDYFSGGNPEPFGVKYETMQEDCLVLNVVTPGIDDKKRAVLFYIHGGGFFEGTGTLGIGSDKFVSEQDVVLVSVNHRLNVFGYLYLGDFDKKYASSGIAGVLDLVLALEWVRDNIAAFGGDPDKVTILGESGGAAKVSTLLAMDCAKGLFRNAVVESGSLPVGATSRKDATDTIKRVLNEVGIGEDNWQQLLTMPADELLALTKKGITSGPVADDVYLRFNESGRFYAPEAAEDVTVIIGCSEEEVASKRTKDLYTVTDDTLRDALLQPHTTFARLGERTLCTEDNVDKVLEILKRTGKPTNDANHEFNRVLSLEVFGNGTIEHIRTEAANKARKKPLYAYLVAYDSQHPMYPDAEGMKYAWHTASLPLQLRIVLHPEDEEMSRTMANSLGAFIRTCDPSTDALEWKPFDSENRLTMVFDDVCRMEKEPLGELHDTLTNQ